MKDMCTACDLKELAAGWLLAAGNIESGEETKLHRESQGTHSCMLWHEGKVVYRSEDISRHNAADKAIGYALLNRICKEECILFTSGRVPKDMVEKTVRAGIPVLVSKSVATKEAADYALACGLQLIWRAWPDRYETYI